MRQDKLGLLWLEWTLATVLGYAVGTLAALPFAVQIAYAAPPAWVAAAVGGTLLGITIGGAQWLVLRRHRLATGGWWWMLASLIGATLGLALGAALAEALAPVAARPPDREAAVRMAITQAALTAGVTGAIFGLALGAAQWLALRTQQAFSAWWIVANGLAWSAALILAAVLAPQLTVPGALLLAGIAAGVVTGLVVQRRFGGTQTAQVQ
jgi:hypothetical protein